jgi:hypothetical protein
MCSNKSISHIPQQLGLYQQRRASYDCAVMLPESNDISAYLSRTLRWWAPAPYPCKTHL